MTTPVVPNVRVSLKTIVSAVLATLAAGYALPAGAEEGSELLASVSVGVGVPSGDAADRAYFGQYNGMRDKDVYGLVGFSYSRRYAATGTWIELVGSDLGLDTRELDFLWKRQGDWRLQVNYGELIRHDPYTVNTGMAGVGSTTPQLNYLASGPGSGANLDLSTKRRSAGLLASKWISSALELTASFTSENKRGESRFGIGNSCPTSVAPLCGPTTATTTGSAVLWLGEPIKSNHSQAELRVNYGAGDLHLTGGYYASFYKNRNDTLVPSVPAALNNPVGSPLPLSAGLQGLLQSPVALAPDNSYHSIDLGGSYVVTDTVLANFKLAFGQARQDQDFATALGAPPAGVSNLGGKIDTSLAQVGFSARPMPKLSVTGSYRYREDKDKTPIAPYGVVGPFTYTNYSIGRTVETARLDATYRFPARFMGTVRLDYEQIDRDTFTSTGFASGVSALRRETTETGVLVEARRSMTATLSGALSVRVSQRDGSRWLQPNSGTGVTPVSDPATQLPATAIFSPTLADRDRERVKFNTTWLAAEGLSLQLSAEAGKDDFDTPSPYAVRSIKSNLFSLDADYTLSDEWHLTGYVSRAQQKLDQARPGGYVGGFKDTGWNAGIGVRGQPLEKLQLGGGLSLMDNTGAYDQGLDIAPAPGSAQLLAATGGLPDITFRLTEVKLFGNYALSAASTVRLDAVYQRVRYDDWAYGFSGVPFLFGDNTTLSQKDRQNVVYFGISYAYTWR